MSDSGDGSGSGRASLEHEGTHRAVRPLGSPVPDQAHRSLVTCYADDRKIDLKDFGAI